MTGYFPPPLELLTFSVQVKVLWVLTPCSDVVAYKRFGGHCCLHLQGEVVSYHITTRRHNPEDHDSNDAI
jgi:hypothetical protein